MFDEKDELVYGKDIVARAKDASELLDACASSGEYVNRKSPQDILDAAESYGCALLAYYEDDVLASCAVMTDKDFHDTELEKKDFLCEKISNHDKRRNFIPDTTRVIWVSSVATKPEYRGRGLARILFAHNEAYAMSQASKHQHIIIASAVRIENDHMASFMKHLGYKELGEIFSNEYFGVECNNECIEWRIFYKALK